MSPVELDPTNPWFSTVCCFLKEKDKPKKNELAQCLTENMSMFCPWVLNGILRKTAGDFSAKNA